MQRISSVSAVGIIAILATPALAQSAPADRSPELGEIIVTANKRSESVQRIAASVTAVSGDTLQERGLQDIQDIVKAIPNLNFGSFDTTTLITIRGVGSTVDSGITEPTVAMYVDGVFLPRSTMSTLRAVDLERVEVLRGPQGTLYGRNATGGAINFISRAPTNALTAGVNLSAGSRDAFGVSGYVSGPLAEGFLVRLSGGREKQDGYVRVLNTGQTLAGTDVHYARAAVRLEPADGLTADLSVRYEQNDAANAYHVLTTPFFAPASVQSVKPNTILADQRFDTSIKTFIASATFNWIVSDQLSVRSISSYVDHKTNTGFDADGTLLDFYNVPSKAIDRPSESYAQELQLIGDTARLKWLVGAYYFNERADNVLPVRLGSVGGAAFGLPANSILLQKVAIKQHSVALFGDFTYSLSERLRLNAGLRLNDEKQAFVQTYAITPGVVDPALQIPLSASKTSILPKIAVIYDIAPTVMGYAQWSKGYKSGGVNLPGGGAEFLGPLNGFFKPETISAFEIGLKSQTSDRKLTANLAAFYYDYKDLQITRVIPPAATLVNNSDAEVYGAEAELTWRPAAAFMVNASGTYTHARFRQFSALDVGTGLNTVLDGKPLPLAPDFTGSVGASYKIELGGSLLSSLTLRGDFKYSSRVVLRYFGLPEDSQNGYENVDLSVALANSTDNIHLRLFVNNVTNDLHKINASNFGTGAYYAVYAAPRTWGLSLSFKY